MIETLDRLYAVLSGTRLSALSEKSPEIGYKVKAGALEGVTIIAGVDAAGTGTLPGDCWPRIVLEPLREEEVNTIVKRVTLVLDCGVKFPAGSRRCSLSCGWQKQSSASWAKMVGSLWTARITPRTMPSFPRVTK